MTSIKGRYARIEISLSKAETDKELFLTGDYLNIISITGEGTCKIKLDHRHSQEIDLREITGITGIFERVYLTSDGAGGTCTVFIGAGMAITVSPDPQNIYGAYAIGTQDITIVDTVLRLASESLKLKDVSIINATTTYSHFVGAYNSNLTAFRAHAYRLYPFATLHFREVDMYSLAITPYDNVNVGTFSIIGTTK
jgi:hypothetical protein